MFNFFKKTVYLLFISLLFTINIKNVISKFNSDRILAELFDLSEDEPDIDEGNYDLVIKFKNGFDDDLVTDLFATAHNLERVARIIELNDNSLFHFKLRDSDKKHRRRRKRYLSNKIDKLQEDERIEYVLLQPYLKREKRANLLSYFDDNLNEEIKRIFEQLSVTEEEINDKTINNQANNNVPNFNDKEYGKEWYLINNGQLNTPKDHDLNVKEAWNKGFTGKNITIVIIDDGLDHEHPDFAGKYKPEYSYDYNDENDLYHDPMPSTFDDQNSHGTKCAGAAAGAANNSVCGVGIAYNAFIGGIRILDGPITDVLEARALSYQNQNVDIKSASWGPKDDGAHMEYPGKFVNYALEDGVVNGRNGKGTVFVWASGNGGGNGDDCSCDGYVSNWNVISVGSINHRGIVPFFMEFCPSTMAVVYSGGTTSNRGDYDDPHVRVVATDVRGKCTDSFQGTSSAAPLAAGAIALVLEANPNLTYRDVMYLIAKTSRIPNLEDTNGWIINGANYHVNDRYGFGVLDVGQLVQEAQSWKNVAPRYSCVVEYDKDYPDIPSSGIVKITLNVKSCPNVEQLEHVVANISFSFTIRGDLKLTLISPSNTPSEILSYRRNDRTNKGIKYFPFMTVFNWGESPIGKWTLLIEGKSSNSIIENYGSIDFFALKLFGTVKSSSENGYERMLDEKKAKVAFLPTLEDLKSIYDEEKVLSHNPRILKKDIKESNSLK